MHLTRFVLSGFVVGLTLHLDAQSALDSAPGTGTNTPPVAAAPVVAPVASGTKLVVGEGWEKVVNGDITSDKGEPFFHLTSAQPQQYVGLHRAIAIPSGVTALEFSVKYRVSGLKKGKFPEDSARAILEFLDASNKPIGAAPPVEFDAGAAEWKTISERIAVPEGALALSIMPCLFRVEAGTLDLQEIQVTTLGEADAKTVVEAAAVVAAKKLADENALIAEDLAKPSKSKEIKVSGNKLVAADGTEVWLQGANICNLSIRPDEEHKILWTAHVALTDWNANVIRFPVLDSYWFGTGRGKWINNDAEAYRAVADKVIKMAAGHGAYVVFDLHRYMTPDASCVAFWKDAAPRYANNPAVLFDIINEPHGTTWEVWRNGGEVKVKKKDGTFDTVQGVGLQTLVNTVREAGAKNIIVAGGLGYAYDHSGINDGYELEDKTGNGIVYSTHFYNWHSGWAKHVLVTAAKHPVLVGECGADPAKMSFIPAKQQEDAYTWAPDAIGFIQKNHLNWTAWCLHTRATPNMLLDWDYCTPTPYWGAFVKDALNGQPFEMKRER